MLCEFRVRIENHGMSLASFMDEPFALLLRYILPSKKSGGLRYFVAFDLQS